MKLKPIALCSFIFVVALVSGCGSASMQMQMDEIRATANEALRTANTAEYNASVAKDVADEALSMMQTRSMMKDDMMKDDMMKFNK